MGGARGECVCRVEGSVYAGAYFDDARHTGAILSQADATGDWRPVAYYSKAMQSAERNCDIYDKELLSIVRALEMRRPYLEGSPHKGYIFSDHRNLEFFMATRALNCRQARRSLFLNRFNFGIIYRPGRLSAGPDGLSRRSDHEVPAEVRDNAELRVLPPERLGEAGRTARGAAGEVQEAEVEVQSRRRAVVMALARGAASEAVERVGQVICSDAEIQESIRVVARADPKLAVVWGLANAPGRS